MQAWKALMRLDDGSILLMLRAHHHQSKASWTLYSVSIVFQSLGPFLHYLFSVYESVQKTHRIQTAFKGVPVVLICRSGNAKLQTKQRSDQKRSPALTLLTTSLCQPIERLLTEFSVRLFLRCTTMGTNLLTCLWLHFSSQKKALAPESMKLVGIVLLMTPNWLLAF